MGRVDYECPVKCGSCCDYWRDAFEAEEDVDRSQFECPFLDDEGCTLSRDERPSGCVEYLCDLGRHAHLMTEEEILWVVDHSAQVCPEWWPRKLQRKCKIHRRTA